MQSYCTVRHKGTQTILATYSCLTITTTIRYTTRANDTTKPTPQCTGSNCITSTLSLGLPPMTDRWSQCQLSALFTQGVARHSSPSTSDTIRSDSTSRSTYTRHKKQKVHNHKTCPNLYTRNAVNGTKCKQANDVKCSQLRNKTELRNNVVRNYGNQITTVKALTDGSTNK